MDTHILGLFKFADSMIEAAARLKDKGYETTVFSPIPLGHELEHKLGERPNFIKYFTFLGSAAGLFFGLVLTLGTAAMYILPRGGRPVWFITPTLLMSYETTILIGVFFTLGSFLLFAKLPSVRKRPYDEATNVDDFGLMVENVGGNYDAVEKILIEYGANEVKRLEE